MTTSIKVKACCAPSVEVVIKVKTPAGDTSYNVEQTVLQSGEEKEVFAYDLRLIEVFERVKQQEEKAAMAARFCACWPNPFPAFSSPCH